jgi:protein RecA
MLSNESSIRLSTQMERRRTPAADQKVLPPETPTIGTGSTLLDLAISGGRFRNGGLPGGILVEIFGPSATGKTVLLSEIAGGVQRKGGEVRFMDPEGRLNKAFAGLFGLNADTITYDQPDTVTELFAPLHDWEPKGEKGTIHVVCADSLAALSTNMELEADEGDKMGMRRAKEFSQELRTIARKIVQHNILMVCSNQVRMNLDAGPYGQKYKTPGGEAIGFYSSVRLRTMLRKKLKREKKIRGKDHSVVAGVEIEVEVFKNSIWKPYNTAPVYIDFSYGIDDVKANLQYIKTNTGAKTDRVDGNDLSPSLDKAAELVEEQKMERRLKRETVNLWNDIQKAFENKRVKRRFD